jgi:glycosyltransferase involved in cell wall biosynthesis
VRNDVAASVSPLKVYEYMACGRPVLATGLRSLERDPIGAFVYRGEEMQLEEALDRALALGSDDFAALASVASQATWDRRFESLREGLEGLGAAPGTWISG